jgi:hypothetical protein
MPLLTIVFSVYCKQINDTPHLFAKNFAAAVERDSGGRTKSEVYPASQLGSIPRQIEGTQFGAIQGANIPPEFCRSRRALRGDGGARPGRFYGAWTARCRRSGGVEADARASPSRYASSRKLRFATSPTSKGRRFGSSPPSSRQSHLIGLLLDRDLNPCRRLACRTGFAIAGIAVNGGTLPPALSPRTDTGYRLGAFYAAAPETTPTQFVKNSRRLACRPR